MGNSKISFSDFKKENNSERRGSNSRNRNGKNIQNNNWNSPKFKVTEIRKRLSRQIKKCIKKRACIDRS